MDEDGGMTITGERKVHLWGAAAIADVVVGAAKLPLHVLPGFLDGRCEGFAPGAFSERHDEGGTAEGVEALIPVAAQQLEKVILLSGKVHRPADRTAVRGRHRSVSFLAREV